MVNNINDLTNTLRPPLHEAVLITAFFLYNFMIDYTSIYKILKWIRGFINELDI